MAATRPRVPSELSQVATSIRVPGERARRDDIVRVGHARINELRPRTAETLSEHLAGLVPTGVYTIELVEKELPRYGFSYDRRADALSFRGASLQLGAKSAAAMFAEMARDAGGGMLDSDLDQAAVLVEAPTLAVAVHRLVLPGHDVPDCEYASDLYVCIVRALGAHERATGTGGPLQ